jgi:hypothetical protein
MSKVNRFAVAAAAAALSLESVAGLVQTSTPAQSDQTEAVPGFRPMMGGWGRGPMGMMGYGMGPWTMGAGALASTCAMASHVDGRLAHLKAELKITDVQEPFWKHSAATVRDKRERDACSLHGGDDGLAGTGGPQPDRSNGLA